MGGNLKSYLANGTTIAQQLINPNLLTIVNDGRDELIGGGGDDNIVFEADAGIIEGGATIDVDDAETDTLWLTNMSLGTSTAALMTTDGILRFDLGVGKVAVLTTSLATVARMSMRATRQTKPSTLVRAACKCKTWKA